MAERADSKANGKDSIGNSESQGLECDALEDMLARLRVSYEQYFLGADRQPPTTLHTTFRQRLERLKQAFVRNSVVRFRVGNFAQKAMTYERLWQRTLQEMENGTYRRDLFKARRKHQQRAEPELPASGTPPAGDPSDAPGSAAAGGGTPGAVAGNAPPALAPALAGAKLPKIAPMAPAAKAAGQLSDSRIRDIYDAYVAAKRQCNEDTSKLTMESLASTLRKQVPDLLKRHQAQAVDFKVVIKDGKAVLRPVPK